MALALPGRRPAMFLLLLAALGGLGSGLLVRHDRLEQAQVRYRAQHSLAEFMAVLGHQPTLGLFYPGQSQGEEARAAARGWELQRCLAARDPDFVPHIAWSNHRDARGVQQTRLAIWVRQGHHQCHLEARFQWEGGKWARNAWRESLHSLSDPEPLSLDFYLQSPVGALAVAGLAGVAGILFLLRERRFA